MCFGTLIVKQNIQILFIKRSLNEMTGKYCAGLPVHDSVGNCLAQFPVKDKETSTRGD